jgi:DNA-directed RNA polymerase specialized sigma24 family protein|tara:strand:- start:3623 stop:3832 length:210 start_codon:yes stop_codon:yes gene_type:complete
MEKLKINKTVVKEVKKLSRSNQRLIILRDVYGKSFEEISIKTGLTEDEVKSKIFKIRKKIKDKVKPLIP